MKTPLITLLFLLALPLKSQTIQEVEREIRRQGLPCPKIVLAQARLETGNFTSKLCKQKHNLFGIKHKGRYASYRTWRESISDYKKCISSRYKEGSYYSFLKSIGYAKDSKYLYKLKRFK
jgi:flagellum-specific peptidoglycan hydrolase FlgJ